jgi:hypothetical protein
MLTGDDGDVTLLKSQNGKVLAALRTIARD